MLDLNKRLSGTAAVLLAAFFWSLSPLLVKYVEVDPLLLPAIRSVMAGLLLLPWFKPRLLVRNFRLPLMLVAFAGISVCAVIAYRYTAAANATALYFSSPLWVFLATSILARRLNRRSIPAVLLLLSGIMVIVIEPKLSSNQLGNLMGLAAGFCFACFALCFDRVPHESRISHLALCNICAVPQIALLILVRQPQTLHDISGLAPSVWLFLLLMAVTQQMIPYFLYGIGLSKLPIFRVSMLGLGEFVLAPVWTFLLLRDVPTAYGIIGWLLVLIGLLLNLYLGAKEERNVPQNF
jgi:drug/metabolite transporter (DMT)-like permease